MSDIKLSSITFNGGQTQDVLLLDQAVRTPAVRWMEVSGRHIGLRMNPVETHVLIRHLLQIIVYEVLK